MEYVLLTDDESGYALVACPDRDNADRVMSAAVWSDGGVDAWRLPAHAFTEVQRVIDTLTDDGNCSDISNLNLATVPRE